MSKIDIKFYCSLCNQELENVTIWDLIYPHSLIKDMNLNL